MENQHLTLLQEEILWVLRKIEYCCESAELLNPKEIEEKKFLKVFYTDKDHSDLEKIESTNKIEKYLQKNGVDFHLTYNFIDSLADDHVELGIIKGENIQDIKTKIVSLKNKINQSDKDDLEITLRIQDHELVIGKDKISWDSSSLEWSMFYILMERNKETGWDEILEHYTGDKPTDTLEQKKKVGDTRDRINKKVSKESVIEDEFIKRNNNQYKFARKVIKGD